jgi:hypothetical protein
MFESGDIVEYVDGTDSQLLTEENRGLVNKGELFYVIPSPHKGHIKILISCGYLQSGIDKTHTAHRYSKCFRLVVRKNRYGYILILCD